VHRDSLAALADSVRVLRARIQELIRRDTTAGGRP